MCIMYMCLCQQQQQEDYHTDIELDDMIPWELIVAKEDKIDSGC